MTVELTHKIVKAYLDGYSTGLYWPDDWHHIPGGPFVYDSESQKENEVWRYAWSIGVSEKLHRKQSNPLNSVDKNKKLHGEKP